MKEFISYFNVSKGLLLDEKGSYEKAKMLDWFKPLVYLVVIQVLFSGLTQLLNTAEIENYFTGFSGALFFFGAVAYFVFFFLFSLGFTLLAIFLATWFIRLLGGVGEYKETVKYWTLVTFYVSIILSIATFVVELMVLLLPVVAGVILEILYGIAALAVGIWVFVMTLGVLARLHKVSRWRVFGAFLLEIAVFLLIFLIILIFVVLIGVTTGIFGPEYSSASLLG